LGYVVFLSDIADLRHYRRSEILFEAFEATSVNVSGYHTSAICDKSLGDRQPNS
jgi:hypothetical protein